MNNWILGRRWLVVQSLPRAELVAYAAARRAGWAAFLPRYATTLAGRKQKPRTVILAYLPGYLFAESTRYLDPYDLSKCQGVASVLRNGEGYAHIPDTDHVMHQLLKMADDDGMVEADLARKPITPYKAGDRVVLQNCPFELQQAVIDVIDHNRAGAWVWAQILGGPVRLHVKHEHIGEVLAG